MNHTPALTIAAVALTAAVLPAPVAASAAPKEAALKTLPAIELGAPFCDNAVLQRQVPVPVWGWSKPGTKITVTFAGRTKTATAGTDGKWTLTLDALKASFDPAEMVISDDAGREVTLKNILVGEVWMASGQSNMQWKVQKSSCNKLRVEAKVKIAPIREFEVTSVYSALHPIERATGGWKNGDHSNYSAIVSAPAVPAPRGVSYATAGVAFQPALYNRALLPMTPFIYYDHKLVTSKASEAYNVMVHSFTRASFKGIIFLCSSAMFEKDQGAAYGSQLSALANGWKKRFACPDPHFFYTIPSKALAPKITRPTGIKGKSTGYEINHWSTPAGRGRKDAGRSPGAAGQEITGLVDLVVKEVYR
jgi:hypothetical protein